MKGLKSLFTTSITIGIALTVGVLAIVFTSKEPLIAIETFFVGPFSNAYFFENMLTTSIPLILTGLAASIAFSASAFNLGLEGQLYFASLCGTYIACKMTSASPFIAIILILGVAFLIGGFIATISGFLRVKWRVSELISSLLVSYTLIYVGDFFLEGPFKDPSAGLSASPYFSERFILPKFSCLNLRLHIGFFIAIGIAIFLYIFMKKSTLGYELKMVGKNRRFSSYVGIPVKRALVFAMFISGGLAGLAGMVDILGVQGRMIRGYSAGYGWNGIAIALIARNNPLLVIPAAIFFAFLESGANVGSLFSDITPEIARIIQAVIFYLVTAEGVIFLLKRRKEKVEI